MKAKVHALLVMAMSGWTVAHAVLPMREQWQLAVDVLRQGQAVSALAALREFHSWYGAEEGSREPQFRESFLRHMAMAALACGELDSGIDAASQWFGEFPDQSAYRAFMRYLLADAYSQSDRPEKAILHWQTFLQEHPHLPECALIRWQWAELAMQQEDYETARTLLLQIEQTPDLVAGAATVARSALALAHLGDGNPQAALEVLENQPVDGPTAELAELWRSILAPHLTAAFLAQAEPAQALKTNSWMDWSTRNATRLSAICMQLKGRSKSQSKAPGLRQRLWNGRIQREVHKLQVVAEAPSEADEFAALYGLRLATFKDNRNHGEIVLLGEMLAENYTRTADPFLATLYRFVIQALQEIRSYADAETWALRFLADFPSHPDLPDILFLNARTAAEAGRLSSASDQIQALLTTHPAHPQRFAWQMQQAEWWLAADKAETALAACLSLHKDCPPPWLPYLLLQTGLCHAALADPHKADAQFVAAAQADGAGWEIRETSAFERLKLALGKDQFEPRFHDYQGQFEGGRMAEPANYLRAIHREQLGQWQLALAVYEELFGATAAAMATLAREQALRIIDKHGDQQQQLAHACDWLRHGLRQSYAQSPLPLQKLTELAVQRNLCEHFPVLLLQELLEQFLAADARFAPLPLLQLLEAVWGPMHPDLGLPPSFTDWATQHATEARARQLWQVHAAIGIHQADQLESLGRRAGADAIRLRLLESLHGQKLADQLSFILARTAAAYDLPDAAILLEAFLFRFPQSALRPDALLLAAEGAARAGEWDIVDNSVNELLVRWIDAPVFSEALLKSAAWDISRKLPERATRRLELFFERPQPTPADAAHALLLSAQALLAVQRLPEAAVQLQRLLVLYPAVEVPYSQATTLLQNLLQVHPELGDQSEPHSKSHSL